MRLGSLRPLLATLLGLALAVHAQDPATAPPSVAPGEHVTAAPVVTEVPVVTEAPAVSDAPLEDPEHATTVPPETPGPTDVPASNVTEEPVPAHPDLQWYWEHEQNPIYKGQFENFIAHDDTQTCSHDAHATPFNTQVRGVNLGGWLVLEPWLTPSLFYQFLGTQERYGDQAPERTAMDLYTFCTALGKDEANRQLRVHWAKWVTEDDIIELARAGINSLRVPVGDWMFTPYEPYIGCTDGSIEELDRVLDLAYKHRVNVLLDFHGHKDSQNGFDNSGRSSSVKWTSIASTQPVGTTTFEHWPIRTAEWAGRFDPINHNYSFINYENLNQSLRAVERLVNRYAQHPAVLGLQPINEPWELTPIKVLKDYYWKSFKRVKRFAPHWKFVVHDSFRFGLQYWSTFMKGCPDIALDTHIYQAWNNPGTKADFYANSCQQKFTISDMENALMPVIVGEWSLATDNCAMWLNGFNDNLPGFPKVVCRMVKCPIQSTYLFPNFPGTPLDVTKPIQGPYGTGTSGPSFGLCPVSSNTSFAQREPKDEIDLMKNLAVKKLNAFAVGHGWYFWNFKTEFDTRWDFLRLSRQGVWPRNVSAFTDEDGVFQACEKEDNGDFVCRAKRGVKRFELVNGLSFACGSPLVDCTNLKQRFLTLQEQCDWAFNEYWHAYREKGATCDFGGAAHLLTVGNRTRVPPGVYVPQIDPAAALGIPTEISTTQSSDDDSAAVTVAHSKLFFAVVLIGGVVIGAVMGIAMYEWHQRHSRRAEYQPLNNA